MKFCETKLAENNFFSGSHHFLILSLKLKQAFSTQTAIIKLTDVLHFVKIELNHTTLTFGVGVSLTLYWCTATLAGNDFVFGHYFTKIRDPYLRWISVNKYDKALIFNQKGC
jgi:hypothetical protein